MFDWEKMRPRGNTNYYPFPNTTNPYTQPYTTPNTETGGYSYPPPPTKPSCFEAKCTNCPYKDRCKNKE